MNLKKLKKWLRRAQKTVRPQKAAAGADGPPTRAQWPARPPDPVTAKPPDTPRTAGKTALRAGRSPDKPIPSGPVSGRPLSRQGIPILKPDEDLAVHFGDTVADEPQEEQTAVSEVRSAKSQAPTAAHAPEAPVRRNRVGIRRLADDVDLRDYFQETASQTTTPQAAPSQAPPEAQRSPRAPATDVPTDRHGIPRLDNRVDLNQLFGATVDDVAPDSDLGEALRQSLAHDARGLMKKKTGGFFPTRQLSLKEKLRRYPPPQAQLDLHGQTALQARQRAEGFIRTARADGLFTLRIIVGKGLHSQGGAVLPDVIEDLTVALKRQDVVLSYRWEKRIKRKSGSLIVYLATEFH